MTFFIVITCIGILLTMVGLIIDNEDMFEIGFFVLFAVVLLGWGILGTLVGVKTKTLEPVEAKVFHEENACHISYEGQIIKTYTDVASYKFLSELDFVKMEKIQKYNMYGSETTAWWEISREQVQK